MIMRRLFMFPVLLTGTFVLSTQEVTKYTTTEKTTWIMTKTEPHS